MRNEKKEIATQKRIQVAYHQMSRHTRHTFSQLTEFSLAEKIKDKTETEISRVVFPSSSLPAAVPRTRSAPRLRGSLSCSR